jgi:cyclopropane fatty-acyl-phospholipid synthase-like methyltransferase
MTVDLYDTSYDHCAADVQQAVRRETYGEDIGQTGWMTTKELCYFLELLAVDSRSEVLEVGSGAGGCALFMARQIGCCVTGIDINEHGIRNANSLARKDGLEDRVRFERLDASQALRFENAKFDAVFSNDAVCHISNRPSLLKEWHRVLTPGGRILFTDALIITGIMTNEEIATRSSIGHYLFLPPGENERLIREAEFELLSVHDLTESAALISHRWWEARERRREDLIGIEGDGNFNGLQKFLACIHRLSVERRLSRCAYLARKKQAAC